MGLKCVLCNKYASKEHCLSDMHKRNVEWYGAAANQRRQRALQRMGIGQQQPQQQQQQPQQAWHRSPSNNTHRGRSRAPAQQVAGIQQQQQQPQLLPWPAALQGVDGDPWAPWALVDQMPEPTAAMVLELGNFIEYLKFPAFPWRNLLNAHNTCNEQGRSINNDLQSSMVVRNVPGGGVQASVDWPNSYRWQDGLRISGNSGTQLDRKIAVQELCRNTFVKLCLRAPAPLVRILPKPFAASPDAELRIWARVRELQQQQSSSSSQQQQSPWVPQGVAGIPAATPQQPPPAASNTSGSGLSGFEMVPPEDSQ